MQELTKRQQKILDFIHDYFQRNGYQPSIREMARKMKIKSPRGIVKHLMALEKKGHLQRESVISRGIKLARTAIVREIPILGRIAAGQPILAVENIEGAIRFDPGLLRTEQTFFLRIKGMSMRDVGIFDGDLVLVRQQPTAENGDIVAALVGDEEATIKRLRQRKDAILLEAANPEFKPIIIRKEDTLTILGKVLLSLRIVDGNFLQNIISLH